MLSQGDQRSYNRCRNTKSVNGNVNYIALRAHKFDWHIAWHLGMEIKCLLLLYFRSPGESLNHRGDSAVASHYYFTRQSFDSVGKQEVKYIVLAIRMKEKCQHAFSEDQNRTDTRKEATCVIVYCKKRNRELIM